jgi:hypothetical protein
MGLLSWLIPENPEEFRKHKIAIEHALQQVNTIGSESSRRLDCLARELNPFDINDKIIIHNSIAKLYRESAAALTLVDITDCSVAFKKVFKKYIAVAVEMAEVWERARRIWNKIQEKGILPDLAAEIEKCQQIGHELTLKEYSLLQELVAIAREYGIH